MQRLDRQFPLFQLHPFHGLSRLLIWHTPSPPVIVQMAELQQIQAAGVLSTGNVWLMMLYSRDNKDNTPHLYASEEIHLKLDRRMGMKDMEAQLLPLISRLAEHMRSQFKHVDDALNHNPVLMSASQLATEQDTGNFRAENSDNSCLRPPVPPCRPLKFSLRRAVITTLYGMHLLIPPPTSPNIVAHHASYDIDFPWNWGLC